MYEIHNDGNKIIEFILIGLACKLLFFMDGFGFRGFSVFKSADFQFLNICFKWEYVSARKGIKSKNQEILGKY